MAFGFITNIKNGFLAANEVRKIVLSDPQLFVYPILAVVLSIVAFLILGVGGLLILTVAQSVVLEVIALFVMYIAVVFITVYFLVAMLISFREFANKKPIKVGEALSRANQYLVPIFQWVIFISVIKILLDVIEMGISTLFSRFGIIGNIVSNLITGIASFALAVATLFAVPVIIDEKTGPFETIKRSTKFIIGNWGETFGGFVYTELLQVILSGIGAIFLLLSLISLVSVHTLTSTIGSAAGLIELVVGGVLLLVIFLLLAMSPIGSLILFVIVLIVGLSNGLNGGIAIFLAGIGVLLVILGHLLNYMMFNCFKLIVYDWKTKNTLPADFDKSVIDQAVKVNPKAQSSKSSGSGLFGNILGQN